MSGLGVECIESLPTWNWCSLRKSTQRLTCLDLTSSSTSSFVSPSPVPIYHILLWGHPVQLWNDIMLITGCLSVSMSVRLSRVALWSPSPPPLVLCAEQHNVTQRIILHVMEYFWCILDSHIHMGGRIGLLCGINGWLVSLPMYIPSCACERRSRERLMFIPTCQFHYKRNCSFALQIQPSPSIRPAPSNKRIRSSRLNVSPEQ